MTAYETIESNLDNEDKRSGDELSDSTLSLSDESCSSTDLDLCFKQLNKLGILKTSEDASSVSGSESVDPSASQKRKKSVRFSQVYTREYNVVEEQPSPDVCEDEAPRRTLGWDYVENETDVESHLEQAVVQRKEKYARLIHEHIIRAEKEREEKKQQQAQKKKGWKARIKRALKPIGHGFMEASTRTNIFLAGTPF